MRYQVRREAVSSIGAGLARIGIAVVLGAIFGGVAAAVIRALT
jgi:hypothetical protein